MKGLVTGRIVHYVMDGNDRAAVVTHVWDAQTGLINLFVFPDGSKQTTNIMPTSVYYDEKGNIDNTWHWIEKA